MGANNSKKTQNGQQDDGGTTTLPPPETMTDTVKSAPPAKPDTHTEVLPAKEVTQRKQRAPRTEEKPQASPSLTCSLPSLGNVAGAYDINPSQTALMKRWKANKAFRESGLEAELAKSVLGDNWEVRYHLMLRGFCPLSFPDEDTFKEFMDDLINVLVSEGLTGWVALRGSSTTFMSVHPEKGIDPDVSAITKEFEKDKHLTQSKKSLHYFDCKVINAGGKEQVLLNFNGYQQMEIFSDMDFNIKSPELIARLKKGRAAVSSSDVGGCYNQDATMDTLPGLWELKAVWGERLQRDLSFVGVTTAVNNHKYTDHPFTYKIGKK